ncbi:MAG: DUF4352 domain-containing protein [Dehalococcoidia bacterium]|nr:DUF4352 domain-containing protein [Dehalococcoidia bacterium]
MAKKSPLEQQLDDLERLRAKGTLTDEEYQARRAAIMSAAPAAPDPKKGGAGKGIMKWGALGCLGILGVVGLLFIGLIVLIGAALSGAGDDDPDSGGDVRVALAAGATGVIAPEGNGSKKSQVTIVEFVDPAEAANQFIQPEPGKKWVGFNIAIENVGDKETSAMDWKLRDSKDVEHDREYFTGADGQLESIYDLTPGGKSGGWIYFEIDADATVKWLRADPNPILAHDLYFDAP